MQIFGNVKWHFYYFMEFYVIHLKKEKTPVEEKLNVSCAFKSFQKL